MTQYPLTYIRLLVRMLKLDALQQKQLFARTALTPHSLEQLGGTLTQEDTLLILGNLANLTEHNHLGLLMGDRFSLASHGPLGQLLSAAPTLAEAWQMLEKYHMLRLPFMAIRCSQHDQYFVFNLALISDIDHPWVLQFVLESVTVTIQRSVELILGRRLTEALIELPIPAPSDEQRVAEYLSGQLNYNAPSSRVLVPLSIMQLPNPYSDPVLWEQTLQLCTQLHESSDDSERSLEKSIRQLLQKQTGKLWSLEEISARFHMSSRTMIRRLKTEGTRYQAIMDSELEKQAKMYLLSPGHSVESVACALGYHDTSAFRRAFRRWCSMSPSQWQQTVQRGL